MKHLWVLSYPQNVTVAEAAQVKEELRKQPWFPEGDEIVVLNAGGTLKILELDD